MRGNAHRDSHPSSSVYFRFFCVFDCTCNCICIYINYGTWVLNFSLKNGPWGTLLVLQQLIIMSRGKDIIMHNFFWDALYVTSCWPRSKKRKILRRKTFNLWGHCGEQCVVESSTSIIKCIWSNLALWKLSNRKTNCCGQAGGGRRADNHLKSLWSSCYWKSSGKILLKPAQKPYGKPLVLLQLEIFG